MVMIMIAASQFTLFRTAGFACTVALASASTTGGINLKESEMSMGTIIKSSIRPSTGMKSGIRSMGLRR